MIYTQQQISPSLLRDLLGPTLAELDMLDEENLLALESVYLNDTF